MAVNNFQSITGYLGNDATKNTSASGKPVINFRVAVDDSFKKSDGTWDNRTIWYDCVLWADRRIDDLLSGTLVTVQGTPRLNEYTKRDGTKGYATRITVDGLRTFPHKKQA